MGDLLQVSCAAELNCILQDDQLLSSLFNKYNDTKILPFKLSDHPDKEWILLITNGYNKEVRSSLKDENYYFKEINLKWYWHNRFSCFLRSYTFHQYILCNHLLGGNSNSTCISTRSSPVDFEDFNQAVSIDNLSKQQTYHRPKTCTLKSSFVNTNRIESRPLSMPTTTRKRGDVNSQPAITDSHPDSYVDYMRDIALHSRLSSASLIKSPLAEDELTSLVDSWLNLKTEDIAKIKEVVAYIFNKVDGLEKLSFFLHNRRGKVLMDFWFDLQMYLTLIRVKHDTLQDSIVSDYALNAQHRFIKSKYSFLMNENIQINQSQQFEEVISIIGALQVDIVHELKVYWLPQFLLHCLWTQDNSILDTVPENVDEERCISKLNFLSQNENGSVSINDSNNGNMQHIQFSEILMQDSTFGHPFGVYLKNISSGNNLSVYILLIDFNNFIMKGSKECDFNWKRQNLWSFFHRLTEMKNALVIDNIDANMVSLYSKLLVIKELNKKTSKELLKSIMDSLCAYIMPIYNGWENAENENYKTLTEAIITEALNKKQQMQKQHLKDLDNRNKNEKFNNDQSEHNDIPKSKKSSLVKGKRIKKKKKVNLLAELPENQEVLSLEEIMKSKRLLIQLKNYVQNHEGRDILNKLLAYSDILSYFSCSNEERLKKANTIQKTYLDLTSRRSLNLPEDFTADANERPSSPFFQNLSNHLSSDLEECCKTFSKFQSSKNEKDEIVDGSVDVLTEDQSDWGGGAEMAFKGRRRKNKIIPSAMPSQNDKMSFLRAIHKSQSNTNLELDQFRVYLVNEAEWEGFSRLQKDLDFFIEVQKFKEMYSFLDEISLTRKAEVIVDVFIDSTTPPWLQIDIPADLASKISNHIQQSFSSIRRVPKDQRDPTIFDEAQSTVMKELLPFWADFQQKYMTINANYPEKTDRFSECQRKRLEAFIQHQTSNGVFHPNLKSQCSKRDKVREAIHFSMTNGFKWMSAPLPPLTTSKQKS